MRKLLLLAPLLAAAARPCAAGTPSHGETPGRACDAERRSSSSSARPAPGRTRRGDPARESGAQTLRWAPPGWMMTMDFSPSG